jgi:aryl-alcohol dehydrogenase-like predicted oxidoreductase
VIHPVAAIQSELSLWTRDALGEVADNQQFTAGGDNVVAWCTANDVAFVPFAPLGRGYLTGTISRADFTDEDFRAHNPRFAPESLSRNARIADTVRAVADDVGVTPAQLALAWVLAQGEHVIPIPGTKKQGYLHENIAANDVHLTDDHLRALNGLPAPVGSRY